ncbi:MAG: hybrid sensor histidine kinase/response regulator [Chitinophagaceae bacterium]
MTELEKIKVIYIDDEMNNLIGFKASFRLVYKVYTAHNTSEAFDLLLENPDMRIIFCDQRMPDKTGVQFFEEIRIQFPHPIRILLTAYTDIESVIDAINRGHIYRYVRKPWINADIISAIEEGNRFYTVNSMIAIKNEELQKAYEELDKFAYSITHDIRSPLLSIRGAMDVAQYVTDLDEMKRMLGMMEDSVNNLDNYIQNIHDYYSLKRGNLQIEEINFEEIVRELKDNISQTHDTGKVNFSYSVRQHEPFRSDKLSIKIILNNLLSNAYKYQDKKNDHKTVDLSIHVATGIATINIKDNGIGIQLIHVNDIFNMYFRASTEALGSGFGLYNVKDALLKLNGKIDVNSIIGKGSDFKVVIPNK